MPSFLEGRCHFIFNTLKSHCLPTFHDFEQHVGQLMLSLRTMGDGHRPILDYETEWCILMTASFFLQPNCTLLMRPTPPRTGRMLTISQPVPLLALGLIQAPQVPVRLRGVRVRREHTI